MRVKGEGPKPARRMLIGEAPGYNEALEGRPFVGKSGKELSQLLARAHIDRAECYITNIVKLQPPFDNKKQQPPSADDIARDAPELLSELSEVGPLWIGAIGRVATRYLVGDIDMESAHGMAFPLRQSIVADAVGARLAGKGTTGIEYPRGTYGGLGWERWSQRVRVVPIYHPAAALHNPELQPLVWYDVQQFSKFSGGKLKPIVPIDTYSAPDYRQGLNSWRYDDSVIGIDTEGSTADPWSIQLSASAGTGRLVRFDSSFPVTAVQRALDAAPSLVFQHVLHDESVIRSLGLELDWSKVEDTYLMADVLRLVPRGLKAGARRDCGMSMISYPEIIAPAEQRLALVYVESAISARVCFDCGGSGKRHKTRWELKAADDCPLCGSYGKVPRYGKSGQMTKSWDECSCLQPVEVTLAAVEACPECEDGGLWEPRSAEAKFDYDAGVWKASTGWSVQRYLRNLADDTESGKFQRAASDAGDDNADEKDDANAPDSPRKRWNNWPTEVREQIAAALGTPMPTPTLSDIALTAAVDYGCRDADATLRRYPVLRAQVEEMGLMEAYKLDLSVMPVAAEMQRNGMHVNRRALGELSEFLRSEMDRTAAELEFIIGRPINPASSDQVAELLYGKQRLSFDENDERDFSALTSYDITPEKFTKSGKRGTVDDKALEGLKLKYADNGELVTIIDLILQHRTCSKIDGTYATKLPMMMVGDRIHTQIKIGPATFRWASASPNLQNIPAREKHGQDLGKRVRACFDAEDGRVIYSRDFSQIEVRMLAWYSQDVELLRVFSEGQTCPINLAKGECFCHDIHALTASKVFRIPYQQFIDALARGDKDAKSKRTSAKNIKFGIVYGVTARGLKAQMELRGLHWTLQECEELIRIYLHEAYPGIGKFMADAHAEARRENMVRSLFGHIRYTPAVHSAVKSISEEALRQAANFKIQCSSSELLKVSMRELWRNAKPVFDEIGTRMLMAVHDEVLLEVPEDEEAIRETDALMEAYMTNPVELEGIDITSAAKWGRCWADCK